MPSDHVIVLGAGFQGMCVSLALAQKGYSVTMVDKAPNGMLRASRVNEGKIHLGHIYANDSSFATARLMLNAAMQFGPLVERLVAHPVSWKSLKSNPFTYVIAKDSIVPKENLITHYEKLNKYYQENFDKNSLYLGQRPDGMFESSVVPEGLNPHYADAAITTPEVAVCPEKLAKIMRSAVKSRAGIKTLYGHRVKSVTRTGDGFKVEGDRLDGEYWREGVSMVVNCLWTGRLEFDQQLGIEPDRSWVYRLKYRVLADLPRSISNLPSLSFVLGAFGDIVTRQYDNTAYLSWYPCCMRGWCNETQIPLNWEGAISGSPDSCTAQSVLEETLIAFDKIIPGIKDCQRPQVSAGVIFSWGETDIVDLQSHLHERHDIGLHEYDGYFSIDTGKLTCAPLFARQLIEKLA